VTTPDDTLLQDLLDGRLEPDEAAAVRARLAQEQALRERWDELLAVQRLVREHHADAQPPEDFLAGVRARIATSTAPRAPATSGGPHLRRAPGAPGSPGS